MSLLLRRRLPGEDLAAPLSPQPALPEDQAWHLEVALGRSYRSRVALRGTRAQVEALLSAVEARSGAPARLPDGALSPDALSVFIDVTEEDLDACVHVWHRHPAPVLLHGADPALRRAAQLGYCVWEVLEAPPASPPWTGEPEALRAALDAHATRLTRSPSPEGTRALQALLREAGPVGERAAELLAELPLSLLDRDALVALAEGEDPRLAGRAVRCLMQHRAEGFVYKAWRLLREADAFTRLAGLRHLAIDHQYPAWEQLFEGPEAHRLLTAAWLRRVPAPAFPADELRAWAGGRSEAIAEEVLQAADALFGPVGREDVLSALVDAVFAEGQTELVYLDRNIEGMAAVIEPELLWRMMLGEPEPEDLATLTQRVVDQVGEEDFDEDEEDDPVLEQLGWHGFDSVEEVLDTLPTFAAELLGRVLRRGRAPALLQRVEALEGQGAHPALTESVREGMERLV